MTDDLPPHPALLPAGLRDVLPPEAEIEAAAVETIMAVFAAHGYQRIKPPLLEFEDGLLAGSGAAIADQIFRLTDPDTHRPVALRADMTPQVARIAASRLAQAARPLRLSYAGQCLRVRASSPTGDRQVAQAGIELIGTDSPEADAEPVAAGVEALGRLGIARLSLDLTMPPLVPCLLDDAALAPAPRAALSHALDRKDAAAVARLAGPLAATLTDLLLAAGPVGPALAALRSASLPALARGHAERLAASIAAIQHVAPTLNLTLDPVEFRGFRYHTGVSTTLYAPGRQQELGRGGRYLSGSEPAAGLTLYPDAVLRVAPAPAARPRVWLAPGHDAARAAALRREGFATVADLDVRADDGAQGSVAAARAQGCGHLLRGAVLEALPAATEEDR